ncbi:SGNH/GDSL hydrolase family protein [Planktothrix mougeotii]|uniref:SGNH/GDSL hydrolase family protein n=1 Tax=Planktothrix mougeotii LEGE 06226 TaxID=1828728 RepID=A0ABR9U9Y8_9CYAN|nr:SGNH/GDSL hydrolase family protein [Planktothrix mougeotii]MBE9143263.1 SGNH/GDSL hydrolase family protein [Planktothrix mougeotii LEGE 06226]
MGQWKAWAVNLGLALSSLVLGIAIGEIGLRLAKIEGLKKLPEPSHAVFSPSFFTQSDLDRGWSNRPGAKGWWQYEGESYVEINSDGLRDQDYAIAKPKNTFRIAVLGDSFTLASQVPANSNYTSVLEKTLGNCAKFKGKNIEVLNFGVDGYGTAQELITLREKVGKYNPDLVIVSFFIGNDVIDNSRKLENNYYRPFFVYKNGQLEPDFSFRNLPMGYSNRYLITTVDHLPDWLVNHSRILQVAKKAELEYRKNNLVKHSNQLSVTTFREPQNSDWKEAWQITEALLRLMAQEVKDKGAKFLLMVIADPMQVHQDEATRHFFKVSNKIDNLYYPNEQLKNIGKRNNFPVLDLAPDFQAYAKQNQVCLHGFEKNNTLCGGHWNLKGHHLAAELITNQLCKTDNGL